MRKAARAEICATGTWGAEYYRVQPTNDDCEVVKHRYSAFVGTTLEVILRSLARQTVVVTGVTTNVCVESTVRDAYMRDYRPLLVEDCTGVRPGKSTRVLFTMFVLISVLSRTPRH